MTESPAAGPTLSPDSRSRLVQCFREVFPDLDDSQIVNAEYAELSAWDSLASITLVVIVEDEFSCTLPDDLVAQLTSFARIHAAVERLSNPG